MRFSPSPACPARRAFSVDILGFEEADWGTDDFTFFGSGDEGFNACKGAQGEPGMWLWVGFKGVSMLCTSICLTRMSKLPEAVNFPWVLEMHVEDPDGHVLMFGTDPVLTTPGQTLNQFDI